LEDQERDDSTEDGGGWN